MGGHRFRTWQPPGEAAGSEDRRRNRRSPAEDEERLPRTASGGGHHPGSETAEKENRQQPLGIPLTYRRPNLAGQCPPHAPSGAETGRIASGQVPRSPAHLRHAGPPERGRHQDGVRNAGTLQRRVHFGHLCPRHDSSPERGGQGHGKSPDGSVVNS